MIQSTQEKLIQSMEEYIQMELKEFQNTTTSHSNRILNGKSHIHELEDKIQLINNNKVGKDKRSKRTEEHVIPLIYNSMKNNL